MRFKTESKSELVLIAYLVSLKAESRILKELHDTEVVSGNTKGLSTCYPRFSFLAILQRWIAMKHDSISVQRKRFHFRTTGTKKLGKCL